MRLAIDFVKLFEDRVNGLTLGHKVRAQIIIRVIFSQAEDVFSEKLEGAERRGFERCGAEGIAWTEFL